MPHECTTCGKQYENGSDQLLDGCRNCQGNTFKFIQEKDEYANVGSSTREGPAQEAARAATASKEDIEAARTENPSDDEIIVAESDTQQSDQSEQTKGLDEIREQLNTEFEGVRIVQPGQYELNLEELFERRETIIQLHEDGRYVIQTPDASQSL